MTSTLERVSRPKSSKSAGAGVAPVGLPQVNLLPPEINADRALGRLKRLLALGLVAVLGLVVVAYIGAAGMLAASNVHLSHAEADSARLTQEQQTYAEVPRVLGQLQTLRSARTLGSSTEISWTPYLGAILTVLPKGTLLASFEETGSTPMISPAAPSNPLQGPSVGRLVFTARSPIFVDTAGVIDALNAIPGFSDAWVEDVKAAEDAEGEAFYGVSGYVQVTEDAFANRFAEEGN